jgi:transposase-like protein
MGKKKEKKICAGCGERKRVKFTTIPYMHNHQLPLCKSCKKEWLKK